MKGVSKEGHGRPARSKFLSTGEPPVPLLALPPEPLRSLHRHTLREMRLLVSSDGGMIQMHKGDPRKVVIATLVKSGTSVGNESLAMRLEMSHSHAMSRLIRLGIENQEILELSKKLGKMLRCAN